MHVAVVCPDLRGHLNPQTTLGRELARRGHRVSVVSGPEAGPVVARAGLDFLPVGVPEHASGQTAAELAELAERTGFAALRLTGRILAGQTAVGLRDLPGVLTGAGVDAVVADQVSPAGVAVAEALGLPVVMSCGALALHQEPAVPPAVTGWRHRPGPLGRARNRLGGFVLWVAGRPLARAVNAYRRRHRLPPYRPGGEGDVGLAQVAQQPAFFDFPRRRLPAHFHYTGPWHAPGRDADGDFPWDRLDGRPLVYASLGTLQNRLKHVFGAILDAASTLDVQLVLALGRPGATWDGPVPANAVVVPYAPQLPLLDRAAVVVTHAGLNTALEALARGRPMLCLPVTNDQPGVARRVEWLGAGEVLPPARATAQRVRAALGRLRSDGRYAAAAAGCRDRMAGLAGVARAADIVEQAFRIGRRVERE